MAALPSLFKRLSTAGRSAPALFAFLFLLSLATTSRERPWGDATPIYEVAESLVNNGRVDIATRWPAGLPLHNGRAYDVHPILPSLAHVPGVLLRKGLTVLWPQGAEVLRAFSCHLSGAFALALTCVLLLGLVRRLGASERAALVTALALGIGTAVFVYARSPYSESMQILCFTGFVAELMAARERPDLRRGLRLGVWTGLMLNTKLVYLAAIPGALLFVVVPLRRRWPDLLRVLGGAAAGLLPFLALILAYNRVRFGSALATGYPVVAAAFAEKHWVGLWGMFLSPGKSVFLYCPPLLLTLVAVPVLLRRAPAYVAALAATIGLPLLASAALFCWSGDYAWGPRYLLFAVPALLAPAGLLLDEIGRLADRARRALAGAAVGAVIVTGVYVQLLGSSLYWDHFIRVAREAAPQWLGTPVKICPGNAPTCDVCFEDMHGLMWLPPFQPIAGQKWLVTHVIAKSDWVTAAADAPWRRYTQVPIRIADSYARARIDWWYLDWRSLTKKAPVVLGAFIVFVLGAAVLLVRAWVRAAAPSRPLSHD